MPDERSVNEPVTVEIFGPSSLVGAVRKGCDVEIDEQQAQALINALAQLNADQRASLYLVRSVLGSDIVDRTTARAIAETLTDLRIRMGLFIDLDKSDGIPEVDPRGGMFNTYAAGLTPMAKEYVDETDNQSEMHSRMQYVYGNTYMLMGDYAKAIEHYLYALTTAPNSLDTTRIEIAIGIGFMHQRRYDEALNMFEVIMKSGRGGAHYQKGFEDAMDQAACETAIREISEAKSVDDFKRLGYAHLQFGETSLALNYLNRCIELAPDDVQAYEYSVLVRQLTQKSNQE